MMKSWADHCSSDEESDDGMHHPARSDIPPVTEDAIEEEYEEEEGSFYDDDTSSARDGGPPAPIAGDYSHLDLPSRPPFTAHLSNLSFKIKDENTLCDQVEMLVDYRYRMEQKKGLVHAVGARFGTDRATGNRKGFGYVDVESLDELILLLNLNDGFSQMYGRTVRIELAQASRNNNKKDWNNNRRGDQQQQQQRVPDIDGSKFQGGRYSNRNNNNNHNNNNSKYNNQSDPKQRPTLKLKPRSVTAENDASKAKVDPFGGAKPRDESAWSKKQDADDSSQTDSKRGGSKSGGRERVNSKDSTDRRNNNKNKDNNTGGRGRGKGRGGGNKGDKSTNNNGRNSNNRRDRKPGKEKERNHKKTDAENKPIPPTVQKPSTENTTKKPAASLNAFAALGFDSDSD